MLLSTQRKIKLVRWHNGTINSINRSRVASKTFLLLHHLDIIRNIVTSAFHHPLGKTSQKKKHEFASSPGKSMFTSVKMFEALRFLYWDWPLRENIKKCLRTKYLSTDLKNRMKNFVYSTYFGKQQRSKNGSATNGSAPLTWGCYCFFKLSWIGSISVAILWGREKTRQITGAASPVSKAQEEFSSLYIRISSLACHLCRVLSKLGKMRRPRARFRFEIRDAPFTLENIPCRRSYSSANSEPWCRIAWGN